MFNRPSSYAVVGLRNLLALFSCVAAISFAFVLNAGYTVSLAWADEPAAALAVDLSEYTAEISGDTQLGHTVSVVLNGPLPSDEALADCTVKWWAGQYEGSGTSFKIPLDSNLIYSDLSCSIFNANSDRGAVGVVEAVDLANSTVTVSSSASSGKVQPGSTLTASFEAWDGASASDSSTVAESCSYGWYIAGTDTKVGSGMTYTVPSGFKYVGESFEWRIEAGTSAFAVGSQKGKSAAVTKPKPKPTPSADDGSDSSDDTPTISPGASSSISTSTGSDASGSTGFSGGTAVTTSTTTEPINVPPSTKKEKKESKKDPVAKDTEKGQKTISSSTDSASAGPTQSSTADVKISSESRGFSWIPIVAGLLAFAGAGAAGFAFWRRRQSGLTLADAGVAVGAVGAAAGAAVGADALATAASAAAFEAALASEVSRLALIMEHDPKRVMIFHEGNPFARELAELIQSKPFMRCKELPLAEFDESNDAITDFHPDLVVLPLAPGQEPSDLLPQFDKARECFESARGGILVHGPRTEALTHELSALRAAGDIMEFAYDSIDVQDALVRFSIPLFKDFIGSNNPMTLLGGVATVLGIPFVADAMNYYTNGRDIRNVMEHGKTNAADKVSIIGDIASCLGINSVWAVASFIHAAAEASGDRSDRAESKGAVSDDFAG